MRRSVYGITSDDGLGLVQVGYDSATPSGTGTHQFPRRSFTSSRKGGRRIDEEKVRVKGKMSVTTRGA